MGGIWGLHPLPIAENNVGGNHLADLGVTSLPFTEKIRQIVFHVLEVGDSSRMFFLVLIGFRVCALCVDEPIKKYLDKPRPTSQKWRLPNKPPPAIIDWSCCVGRRVATEKQAKSGKIPVTQVLGSISARSDEIGRQCCSKVKVRVKTKQDQNLWWAATQPVVLDHLSLPTTIPCRDDRYRYHKLPVDGDGDGDVCFQRWWSCLTRKTWTKNESFFILAYDSSLLDITVSESFFERILLIPRVYDKVSETRNSC